MLKDLIAQIGDLPPWAIIGATFLLAYSETALFLDFVVPGEVGMVLAGAAAADGNTALALVIAAGVLGATLGDTTSYWVGRKAGPKLLEKSKWLKKHLEPSLERAEKHFDRHGGLAIVGGRFVGALRAVVPFVAGTSDMGYGRFLAWNVLASVLWAGTVVSVGYFFGDEAADLVDRVGLIISLVVVAVIIGVIVWRRKTKKK